MIKDERKTDEQDIDEPATVAGPSSFEEELKDYNKTNDQDVIENLPESHPEPSPTKSLS